jgi:hypothetical protein
MPQEKSIDEMNNSELRQALADFVRSQTPAGPQQPDAPGCAGLSDVARDTARTLYGQVLMAKPAGQLTPDERAFLRAGVAAWERGQG